MLGAMILIWYKTN